MKFREIRYNEKKQSILESASRIFAKKGYEKATIEEIAAELKMTRGSFYYYIKSKEELLFHCQVKGLEEGIEMLSRIIKSDLSPTIKMREAIMGHIQINTSAYIVGALQQQHLILPEDLQKRLFKKRDTFQELFFSIVEEGIEQGVFGKENSKMNAFAMLGAINWLPKWYHPDGELTAEDIGEAFSTFFLKGLSGKEQK